MDKARLLKELKKEAFHVKKKIGKVRDPQTKDQLKRNYSRLTGAIVDISKAEI